MISGLKNITSSTTATDLGLKIFLNESFFVTNKNTWIKQDTTRGFSTVNDVQVIINGRNEWDNSFSYYTDYNYYNLNGSSKYDYRFTSWLRLYPEIKGDYQVDSTGDYVSGSTNLTTAITFNKWLFLRSLLNYQTLSLKWNRINGKTASDPDFSYSFRLDITVLPNINISNQESLSYKKGKFDEFSGNLICTIIF